MSNKIISQIMRLLIQAEGAKKSTKAVETYSTSIMRARIEQDKLEKGTSGMGKNSTANFAKMSQGLGGLVHVYATVAANVFALGAAFEVMRASSDIDIMVTAADQLSTSTGISYGNVAQSMKDVTKGALSMQEALRAASIGVSSGLSGKQMEDIAVVATKAANALGRSVPEAINRMTQAVVKNEPELVDEYGIILRVDAAMKDYADSLGKTKAELSSFDKQMAIHAQLIKQGDIKFGSVDEQVNQFSRLSAIFSEMGHSITSFLDKGLTPMANLLADNKGLLYLIAAIFAKGIFKKALPELANYTKGLEAQRQAYKKIIDEKTDILDRLDSSNTEQSVFSSKKSKKDQYIKSMKKLPESQLSEMYGEEQGKIMANSTAVGYNKAWKNVSIDSSNAITKNFAGEISKIRRLSMDNNKEAQKLERSMLGGAKNAAILETSYRAHNDALYKSVVLSGDKFSWDQKALRSAEKLTQQMQLQRAVAASSRSSAFSAGQSGGFTMGGLKEANKQIDAGKFNAIGKAGIRISGIFGNIAGIMGSIMSLVSGWGIALFVVSQVALPIADAIGLTSKKAREAIENSEKLGVEFDKLLETAKKIEATKVSNIDESINKSKATAANLTEQLDKVRASINELPDISISGWFGTQKGSSTLEEMDDQLKNIKSNYKDILGDSVNTKELEDSLDNIRKVSTELGPMDDKIADIKDNLKEENLSLMETHKLEKRLNFLLSEQLRLNTEINTEVKNITESAIEKLKVEREYTNLLTKSKTAIADIAKAETANRAKFAKSSPYFKTLQDLKAIEDALRGAKKADISTTIKDYNSKFNTKFKENDKTGVLNELKEKTKQTKKFNDAVLKGKNAELDVKTKMLVLNDQLSDDPKNIALLETKKSYNDDELASKLVLLNIEKDIIEQRVKKDSSDTLQKANSMALVNVDKQILLLQTENLVKNNAITRQQEEQNSLVKARLALTSMESTILNNNLSLTKKFGSIGEIYDANRLSIDKKIEVIKLKQAVLAEEAVKDSNKLVINNKTIEVLSTNILALEKSKTLEYSKQRELQDQIAARSNLASSSISANIRNNESILNNILNINNRIDTSNTTKLNSLTEQSRLERNMYASKKAQIRLDILAAKQAIKVAESAKDKGSKKQVLEVAKQSIKIREAENALQDIQYQKEEALYQIELTRFELRKKSMDAASVFQDPKEFTELLGREFDILAKNFSDAMIDPVTRTADSVLRITDTAIDTLFAAAAAGENVGKAIMDAVVAVANDITTEITTDIMKQWVRDLLSSQFGIQSKQEQIAAAQKANDDSNTNQVVSAIRESKGNLTNKQGTPNVLDGTTEQINCCKASVQKSVENTKTIADKVEEGTKASEDGFGGMLKSLDQGLGSMIDAILSTVSGGSITTSMGDSGLLGSIGGLFGGIGDSFSKAFSSVSGGIIAKANGGITNSLKRYANGTVTNGPEIALIGDNASGKEAVVPLPNGEMIPVEFTGDEAEGDIINNVTINITGTDTNNADAVRRSAGQVALAASKALGRSSRRNG